MEWLKEGVCLKDSEGGEAGNVQMESFEELGVKEMTLSFDREGIGNRGE